MASLTACRTGMDDGDNLPARHCYGPRYVDDEDAVCSSHKSEGEGGGVRVLTPCETVSQG